jgi:hypothetical protein
VRNGYPGFFTVLINVPLWLFIVFWFFDLNSAGNRHATESENFAAEREKRVQIAPPLQTALSTEKPAKNSDLDKEAVARDSTKYMPAMKPATRRQFVTVTANALNGSGTFWNQAGSLLRLEAIGRVRRFVYLEPAGSPAKRDDLAFEGVRSGSAFFGHAFLFSERCKPIGYYVRGALSPDGSSLTLQGRRPIPNAQCRIAGYEDAELLFNASDKF